MRIVFCLLLLAAGTTAINTAEVVEPKKSLVPENLWRAWMIEYDMPEFVKYRQAEYDLAVKGRVGRAPSLGPKPKRTSGSSTNGWRWESADGSRSAWVFYSLEGRQREIAAAKRALDSATAEAKKPKTQSVPDFNEERSPVLGEVGVIDRAWIVSVIDEHNVIVHIGGRRVTLWISGVDTSGMADNDIVTVSDPLQATGTKMYTSALGARRTVALLTPVPSAQLSKWRDEFKRLVHKSPK